MATLITFIVKDMRHDLGRTLLTVMGLAVVVFIYLLISALVVSLVDLSSSMNRNLIVLESGMIDPADATLDPQALQAAGELVPTLASRVSPGIFRHLRVDGRVVLVRAAPLADWEAVYQLSLMAGHWPQGMDEVAVGEGLAQASGWQVGSQLEIYGSLFHVTGISRSAGIALATVWVPLEAAQELFAPRRDYQMLIVQVAPGVDAEEARQHLQDRLGERYTVFFEDSYTRRNNQALHDLNGLGKAASTIALLAITLGTFTATQLSLAERTREMGILRAIGFSRWTVGRLLLVRALLQGLLAFAAGLAAACAYTLYRQSTAPIFILGYPLIMAVTLRQTLIGLAWTGALAWLGAWLSTRGGSLVPVRDLLKG